MNQVQLAEFTPDKTTGLGRSMFTDYLLAIELAGTVLLVATIGAIVLAQKPERDPS
jgi:NADH-quinone oxidoreductase subunit J